MRQAKIVLWLAALTALVGCGSGGTTPAGKTDAGVVDSAGTDVQVQTDAVATSDTAAQTDAASATDAANTDAGQTDAAATETDTASPTDSATGSDIADGTPCDDGDECTIEDSYQAGKCTGDNVCACKVSADCKDDGNPCNGKDFCDKSSFPYVCKVNPVSVISCPGTGGPCQNPPACNPANGQCEPSPKPDQSTCDDGNACTTGDSCSSGACVSGTNTCLCKQDSDCANKEDGNACNGSLFCNKASGECQVNPATVVVCPTASDTECQKNTCQPQSGACEPVAVANGGPCDDNNGCTTGETCQQGLCGGGADTCLCTSDTDCKDDGNACNGKQFCNLQTGKCQPNPATVVTCVPTGDPCLSNSCDEQTGACVLAAAPTGTTCSDGVVCTQGDGCKDGSCAAGVNACNCQNDGDCAGLGNVCTGLWFCSTGLGKCLRNPATVLQCANADDGPCATTVCDPSSAKCVLAPKNNGALCTDGNPCTSGESCQNGSCVGTLATAICPCLLDSDCNKFEDGDLCNGVLYCDKSAAVPECKPNLATVKSCPTVDNGPCSALVCTPADGSCKPKLAPDGAVCDDGSACALPGSCEAGTCVPGAAVDCNDDNPCTTDACGASGCYHANITGPCNDDTPCTVAMTCNAGKCTGGLAALWDKGLGVDAVPGPSRLARGPDGGVLVALQRKVADVDEVVVRLYSGGGEQLWQQVLQEDGGVQVRGLVWTGSVWWLGADIGATQNTQSSMQLYRLLPQGTVADTVAIGDPVLADGMQDLALLANGDLVAAGWRNDPWGTLVQQQAYVVRVSSTGSVVWQQAFGGDLADRAVSVLELGSGDLVALVDANVAPEQDHGTAQLVSLALATGTPGTATAVAGMAQALQLVANVGPTTGTGWAVGTELGGDDWLLVPLSSAGVAGPSHAVDTQNLMQVGSVMALADGGLLAALQVSPGGDFQGELVRLDSAGWPIWRQPWSPGAADALQAAVELDDGALAVLGLRDVSQASATPRLLRWSAFGHATCAAAGSCADLLLTDCATADSCEVPTCSNSTCGTAVRTCADDGECATENCDPALGCVAVANTNNCNDDNSCTTQDKCKGGSCTNTPKTCADNNACTLDYCAPGNGCTYLPVDGAPCDDGNLCTTDLCAASACVGTPVTCPDAASESCPQIGICKPATGCGFAQPYASGQSSVVHLYAQSIAAVADTTDFLLAGTTDIAGIKLVAVERRHRDNALYWSWTAPTGSGSLVGAAQVGQEVIVVTTEWQYFVLQLASGVQTKNGSIFTFAMLPLNANSGFADADGVHFCGYDTTFKTLTCWDVANTGATKVTGVVNLSNTYTDLQIRSAHKVGTQWAVGFDVLGSNRAAYFHAFDTAVAGSQSGGFGLPSSLYNQYARKVLRLGDAIISVGEAKRTANNGSDAVLSIETPTGQNTTLLTSICASGALEDVIAGPVANSVLVVGQCGASSGGTSPRQFRARVDYLDNGKAVVQWYKFFNSLANPDTLMSVAPAGAGRYLAAGYRQPSANIVSNWLTFDAWGESSCVSSGACYTASVAACDDGNPCTAEACDLSSSCDSTKVSSLCD